MSAQTKVCDASFCLQKSNLYKKSFYINSTFILSSNYCKNNFLIFCGILKNSYCTEDKFTFFKENMKHSMSTDTPLLPTISDFAEIWHVCGLDEKMSHIKFQVSKLNSF